jgi:hypothetical protein
MPRNVFTPSFDVPMNVPLSRVAMGGVALAYVVELGAPKAVAAAAQRVKSFVRRKAIVTRGSEWRMLRETYRHYERI